MNSQEKLTPPTAARMVSVAKMSSSGSGSHSSTMNSRLNMELEEPEGGKKITLPFLMTMLGFSLTLIVAELTPLFLATVFTIIAYDLNALDQAVWFTVSSTIAEGAIAPFVGSLSDLFGRRGIILISLAMKVIACVFMGVAPNAGLFMVGSVVSGAALGIQTLIVVAAASEIVPTSRRGLMIGYILVGFMPFAPAALYGQLIAQYSWRWVFLLIGALTSIAFILLAKFYHPPPRRAILGLTQKDQVRRIDWIGFALSVTGVTLFLVGLNWGGETYPWKSAHVICTLLFGLLSLVLFGVWEKLGCKYPMFPARLLKEKRLSAAVMVVSLMSGINYVPVTSFWGIQTYSVYGASWDQAAVWYLPLGFCIFGGAIVGAILITIFRTRVQWVLLVLCILQTTGSATMSLASRHSISTAWAQLCIALFGMGGLLIPIQILYTIIAPPDLIGTNVALSVVIRMIGQGVGKSMFFNILKTELTHHAPSIFALPAISVGLLDVEKIKQLIGIFSAGPFERYVRFFPELDTPEKVQTVVQAGSELYATALRVVYLATIPFGVLACLACLALWGIDRFMDDQILVHL